MPANNITPIGVLRRSKRKVSDFFGNDWSVTPSDGLLDITAHREFTGETLRVLFTMIALMDKANEIKIRTVDVAEHLKIRPAEVSRQIKRLLDEGVLLPRARYGWRLNPHYGFKGEPDKSLRRAPGGELVLID